MFYKRLYFQSSHFSYSAVLPSLTFSNSIFKDLEKYNKRCCSLFHCNHSYVSVQIHSFFSSVPQGSYIWIPDVWCNLTSVSSPLQVPSVWILANRSCATVGQASPVLDVRLTLTTVPVTPAAMPAPAWMASMTLSAHALWASPARTALYAAAPATTFLATMVAHVTLTSLALCASVLQVSQVHSANTPTSIPHQNLHQTRSLLHWLLLSSLVWWLWRCWCVPASTFFVSSTRAGSLQPSPDQ